MRHDYFTYQFPDSTRLPSSGPGQRNISLVQAIDDFFEDTLTRGLRPRSIKNMHRDLDPLTDERFGLNSDTLVSELTRREITTYIQRRYDPEIVGREYKMSVRVMTVRQIKGFFKWLYANGHTDTYILRGLLSPRPDIKRIVPLTDLEIRRVFEEIHGRSKMKLRNAAIFALMLDTGLRRSEVARLKKTDVDLSERTVHAFGKKKERLVGYGVRTAELLALYAGHSSSTRPGRGSDHLFLHFDGSEITEQAVTGLYNWLKRPTGIKRINAHLTRHTFATRFLQRGGSPFTLRILLGHSSLRMVAEYVSTAEATDRDILRDHSIIDDTKLLGSILSGYTNSSVVRRTLTGNFSRKHHKTNTSFIKGGKTKP